MDARLYRQISTLTLIRMIFNTLFRMIYPFLSVLARGVGVDLTTMAYALTARNLVGSLGPFAAAVSDRRGRKFGMVFGATLFTLGATLVVIWPTFPALAMSLILTALGVYVFGPSVQAYLGDSIPYAQRGRPLALTEVGWSLAFIVGVPLMGFLIALHGWMAPFPLMAVLGLLTCAGLALLLPKDIHIAAGGPTVWTNLRTALASAPTLAALCIALCAGAANEVVNLVFGVWLEQSFGLKIAALGAAAAVIGVAELSGEGLVALFVDRLGKPRAVTLGLVADALAALILPALGRTETGALIGLFFFYIAFEFTIVSTIPMMSELLPEGRATLISLNIAFLSLGRAIGAPLGNFLYRSGFAAVTAGAVVFNLLGLLALYRMQNALKKKAPLD